MEQRTCKVCKTPKPLDAFSLRSKGEYSYRLRTCDVCQKEKDRTRTRKYTEENRDEVRRRGSIDKWARYQDDPEFREKVKERSRESSRSYYKKNREKILAKRRERRKAAKEACMS